MKDKKPNILTQGGGYIDPSCCGSTILFNVQNTFDYKGARYYGNIQLTDCSRMISWTIDCDEDGLRKLDLAIRHLQEVRKGVLEGIKQNAILEKQEAKEKEKKKAA